jgi:hypothetical protein
VPCWYVLCCVVLRCVVCDDVLIKLLNYTRYTEIGKGEARATATAAQIVRAAAVVVGDDARRQIHQYVVVVVVCLFVCLFVFLFLVGCFC